MKIVRNIDDLSDFEAWAGGEDTKNAICEAGKGLEFIQALEAAGYTELSETELNDMLWFQNEFCLGLVGLKKNED